MSNIFKYFIFNNSVYIRLDNRTHNFQFLNQEKCWEDNSRLKAFFENSDNIVEVTDENVIEKLAAFPNKIGEQFSQLSQNDFDKLNDIEKLKYMSQISKRTNYIFDNSRLKQNGSH